MCDKGALAAALHEGHVLEPLVALLLRLLVATGWLWTVGGLPLPVPPLVAVRLELAALRLHPVRHEQLPRPEFEAQLLELVALRPPVPPTTGRGALVRRELGHERFHDAPDVRLVVLRHLLRVVLVLLVADGHPPLLRAPLPPVWLPLLH